MILIITRKIRRIIFTDVKKVDNSGQFKHISVSATKQIAGRAGRYGLHANIKEGGTCTTLRPEDLPFLRKTLPIPFSPLPFARIAPSPRTWALTASVLPLNSSTMTLMDAHIYASRSPSLFRYVTPPRWVEIAQFIDVLMPNLTLNDRLLYSVAPISWGDERAMDVVKKFVLMYSDDMHVDFNAALQDSDFLDAMGRVEAAMARDEEPFSSSKELDVLERYHKLAVLYLWFCYRNPVMFSNFDAVSTLKERLERCLNWCLQGMSELDHEIGQLLALSKKPKGNKIPFLSSWKVREKFVAKQGKEKHQPVVAKMRP